MESIQKGKLSLVGLELEHASVLFELADANREYLREWLPWLDNTNTVADTERFIRSAIEQSESGHGCQFAMFYERKICGAIGFHKINTLHNFGAIGYWLAEPYTGRGIVTEAARLLLEIGFKEYGLNKIEIHCAENNIRSRAVAERLGFCYEATLRECEWLYDRYVNHAIYSMLALEYNTAQCRG